MAAGYSFALELCQVSISFKIKKNLNDVIAYIHTIYFNNIYLFCQLKITKDVDDRIV